MESSAKTESWLMHGIVSKNYVMLTYKYSTKSEWRLTHGIVNEN